MWSRSHRRALGAEVVQSEARFTVAAGRRSLAPSTRDRARLSSCSWPTAIASVLCTAMPPASPGPPRLRSRDANPGSTVEDRAFAPGPGAACSRAPPAGSWPRPTRSPWLPSSPLAKLREAGAYARLLANNRHLRLQAWSSGARTTPCVDGSARSHRAGGRYSSEVRFQILELSCSPYCSFSEA